MHAAENFKTAVALDPAFTGKMALDFAHLIGIQAESVYQARGIVFPVSASSAMRFLDSVETASLLDVTRALGHQHQLVAQRVKILLKLELIEAQADPHDKRRTLYRLTPAGRRQAQTLQDYCVQAAIVFEELSSEVGCDLLAALRTAARALQKTTLFERFGINRINGSEA
jgi:DNA-binding MarR family transcriptional regulator